MSGAFVAGKNPEADAELLELFTRSLESTSLLQQIAAGQPNPLAVILAQPERPLLASVVWPTLPAELFEQVQGLDILLLAEFLRRTGGAG